jgi:hypothetical protein
VSFAISAVPRPERRPGASSPWTATACVTSAVTADAFWNSFKAFFIVAPMYLYSSRDGRAAWLNPRSRPTPMFGIVCAACAVVGGVALGDGHRVAHAGRAKELCALRDRLQLDDRLCGCRDHSGVAVAPGRPDRSRTGRRIAEPGRHRLVAVHPVVCGARKTLGGSTAWWPPMATALVAADLALSIGGSFLI